MKKVNRLATVAALTLLLLTNALQVLKKQKPQPKTMPLTMTVQAGAQSANSATKLALFHSSAVGIQKPI